MKLAPMISAKNKNDVRNSHFIQRIVRRGERDAIYEVVQRPKFVGRMAAPGGWADAGRTAGDFELRGKLGSLTPRGIADEPHYLLSTIATSG